MNIKEYAIHRMSEYRVALSIESEHNIRKIEQELIELSDDAVVREAMTGIFSDRTAGETFFRLLRKEM